MWGTMDQGCYIRVVRMPPDSWAPYGDRLMLLLCCYTSKVSDIGYLNWIPCTWQPCCKRAWFVGEERRGCCTDGVEQPWCTHACVHQGSTGTFVNIEGGPVVRPPLLF